MVYMFFVRTSMYFPKMQIFCILRASCEHFFFLHLTEHGHFRQNLICEHFYGFAQIYAELLAANLFEKGSWCT